MKIVIYLTLILSFLTLASVVGGTWGCGEAEEGGLAGATTFEGTVAGNGGETGTFNVTVQSEVATSARFSIVRRAEAQGTGDVPATGECIIVGQPPVLLSGTFTPATGAMNLSSSDGATNFTGTIEGEEASGTFTGPGGLIGGFSALSTANGEVTVFCGTFQHAPECPGSDSGTFNVQIDSNGNLSGTTIVTSGSGSSVTLTGTVTGSTFSGFSSDGNAFSGSIGPDGQSMSGTFAQTCDPNTGTGTFSGNTSACE